MAPAQQPALPEIGYLITESAEPSANYVTALRKGLSETGYVEGRNMRSEFRRADGHYDRLLQHS